MENNTGETAGHPLLEASLSLALTDQLPVLAVSDSIESLLGFAPEVFLSSKISLKDRIHASDADLAAMLFSHDSRGCAGSCNIRLRHANGRIRCFKVIYEKKASTNGSWILDLLLQDAKSLQRTLDEAVSMAHLRAMMENTDDYIYFKDRNHVFTGASQTLVSICQPAEHWTDLIGQTDYDVFPEEYADLYYSLEKRVFSGEPVAQEVQEYLTNEVKKGWVDNRKYPIHDECGQVVGLYGIARDITRLIESEKALAESEERFRALSEASFGGVFLHENKIIFECNSELSRMTGFDHQELIGMDGLKLVAPESQAIVIHNIQCGYDGRFEATGLRKDGTTYPLVISGKNVSYKGHHARVIEFRDITVEKQAKEDILVGKAKLEAALTSMTDAVFISDAAGNFIHFNDAFASYHRFANRDECAKTLLEYPDILDVYLPDGTAAPLEQWAVPRALRGEAATNVEYTIRRKDSGETWVGSYTFAPIRNSDGDSTGSVVTCRDVTEHKQEEKVLSFLAQQVNVPSTRSFFDELAAFLGSLLEMEFVCIDRLEGDGLNATTLSVWHDGTFEDNVTYALKDTPCGEVVGKQVCCFPTGVTRLFPHDEVLQDLQADSYVGVTLFSHNGRPIGLIAVIGRGPLAHRQVAEKTLQMVAIRAAAELERLDTETALRRSQTMLDRTETITHVGGWEWEVASDTVTWSDELFRIFQLDPADGTPSFADHARLYDPDDMHRLQDAVEAAVQKGTPYGLELRAIRKDGSSRICLARGYAERGVNNQVTHLFGSLQDITERKQAEMALLESENRFRSVMENTPTIAVQGYLLDGTVIFWNKASEMLYGYAAEEALGANLLDLIIPDEMKAGVVAAVQHMIATGKTIPADELLLKRKDGSRMPVFSSHALLTPFGRPPELFCLDIDLTERKRIETELLQAKMTAEAASRAKSEFLANMSHEIRTPMNGIIGMGQLLHFTELTDEQKGYLAAITSSGNTLLSLINDILDLSKIEAEKLDITVDIFSLRSCISELVSTQQSRIMDKRLSCKIIIPPNLPDALMGDQLRIKQILLNLLGNAIKFTESGGITVSVSAVEFLDSELLLDITVQDTGIGIPLELQEQIFEPFSQADSSITRHFGGTGLGLTICHRLAELMGGSIRVDSTVGAGSSFCLRLPLQVATVSLESIRQKTQRVVPLWSGISLHILLADDNQLNNTITSTLLKKMGHQVTTVENGKAVLDAIRDARFDLLLLDIKMPLMSGDEALCILREREFGTGEHLPVIALTAFALKDDKEKYLKMGFDGYLAKPATAEEMAEEMQRVMHSMQLP